GVPAFLATALIAGTISVIGARVFAAVFEIPFQRHRSWGALRAAAQPRLSRLRTILPWSRPTIVDHALAADAAAADTTASPAAVTVAPVAAPTVAATATVATATAPMPSGIPQAGILGHVGRAAVPPYMGRNTPGVSAESDP
ncbi:MAG TPA: hypothetical protein VL179_00200, partial [Mycobacterium sp.]|nr:hypothetical protein [Mycobacterium sp.]